MANSNLGATGVIGEMRIRAWSIFQLFRILAFASFSLGWNMQAHAETLGEVIEHVKNANPNVRAAREAGKAAKENVAAAYSGLFPKITANGNAGYGYSQGQTTGSTNGESPIANVSVQARQKLFDGAHTSQLITQAKNRDIIALQMSRQTEQAMVHEAARVYGGVYANRLLLSTTHQNYLDLRNILTLVQRRHALGDIDGTQVNMAKSRVAAAEVLESRAAAAMQASSAEFERIVGASPASLAEPFALNKFSGLGVALATMVADSNNPSLLIAQYLLEDAKTQVGVVRSEYSPTVSVVGNASFDNSYGTSNTNASVLAQLTMPLFSGGEDWARVKQARFIVSQKTFERDAKRNEVHAAVSTALASLIDAQNRMRATSVGVQSSQRAYNLSYQAYQNGDKSMFELLDIKQELTNAQLDAIKAQRDFVLATFTVSQAIGKLDYDNIRDELQQPTMAVETDRRFIPQVGVNFGATHRIATKHKKQDVHSNRAAPRGMISEMNLDETPPVRLQPLE